MKSNGNYDWKFSTIGGVTRVNIDCGEDIAHLDELDQKLWTTLSCPINDLEIDAKTMQMLDTNGDGKIHVNEVIEASKWLIKIVKNPDVLTRRESEFNLSDFNQETEEGKKLYESALQIVENLGHGKDKITVADVSDSLAIFAKTRFNGDGIITANSTDDDGLKAIIGNIIGMVGSATDRSGDPGVNTDHIEKFYADLADFTAWKEAGEAGKDGIFVYGDNTAAATAAIDAIKTKLDDYFMRCKLAAFDAGSTTALDVSTAKIGEISNKNLSECNDEISTYPLTHVNAEMKLMLNAGINPAWKAAFNNLKTLVFNVEYPDTEFITEEQWDAVQAKMGAYRAYMAAKKGDNVEGLGYDAAKALLDNNRKAELLEIVAQDLALESTANSIDTVNKFMHLYRDFFTVLKNFVTFSDFYSRDRKAIFQAGTLYIDQRSCDLCFKVTDMGKQTAGAGLSNMFIVYCDCTCKSKPAKMTIGVVITDGDIGNIRVGKNAIFYDRDGLDWDATIISIIDNPISVRQAFWTPYRKLGDFIEKTINKNAEAKDAEVMGNLTAKVEGTGDASAPKQPFDMTKYVSMFAMVGVAVGAVGGALALLVDSIQKLHWWELIIAIVGILLVISGPAMIKAWLKLRKRNLSPLLNANGWAVNAKVLVNVRFGETLTHIAKYPIVKMKDPFVKKMPVWKKILLWFAAIVVVAGIVYFCIPKEKRPFWPQPEVVVETPVEAPAEEPVAEEVTPVEETPAEATVDEQI
ncbi:MAG: hypothetical protein Q4F69_09340 [Bacteroidia bacterium]|nr:hypothetical protein [Bacteroidia bacterium]